MDAVLLPFLRESGLQSWNNLLAAVGSKEAHDIASRGGREQAMIALRLEKHYTLETIGDIFGLSGERIRQLTPPGIWEQEPTEPPYTDRQFQTMLRTAARIPEAWSPLTGTLLRTWAADKLGVTEHYLRYHEELQRPNLKPEVLLKYGMGFETDDAIKAWYQEEYWNKGHGFERLAQLISERTGVNIRAMSVWHYFKDLGCRRRSPGQYYRAYRPEDEPW